MGEHAAREDCPCCHECLSPGIDTERALVVAFLAGTAARHADVPVGQALCAKHARLAGEAASFVIHGGAQPS